MRTPFEFGHDVGTLTKQAGWGDVAWGLADAATYAIPGVGTARSLWDVGSSLYQGDWKGALGNAALAGATLIPGAGAIKGIGRFAARQGVRGATRAATTAAKPLMRGGNAFNAAENAVSRQVQRIVPVNNATNSWTRKGVNTMVRNPLTTAGVGTLLTSGGAPAAAPAPAVP